MVLKTHRWGPQGPHCVVCVHGLAQRGGVFEGLGQRLATSGHPVLAVDLRGHGDSGHEPPWNSATHIEDLIETLDDAGVERASWVGHSFGGRLVAEAAAHAPARTERLVLLDPGLEVPAAIALRSAEIERLDWSFATEDGALNALLSSDSVHAAPRQVVEDFVRADVRKGSDGRFRFSFCPAAVVVAWSEMSLPAPPIAPIPTLIVRAEKPLFPPDSALEARYVDTLGDLLMAQTVPNGHNVLWESPTETGEAVERFIGAVPARSS